MGRGGRSNDERWWTNVSGQQRHGTLFRAASQAKRHAPGLEWRHRAFLFAGQSVSSAAPIFALPCPRCSSTPPPHYDGIGLETSERASSTPPLGRPRPVCPRCCICIPPHSAASTCSHPPHRQSQRPPRPPLPSKPLPDHIMPRDAHRPPPAHTRPASP